MDPELRATLEAIHASGHQAVVVCAGAGGVAIEHLVALPGSSRTVLEAVIPYSRPAFVQFLGFEPEQFTSAETARALADRAYERASRWAEPGATPLGVSCTATLATTRPKRGAHRAFIAIRNPRAVTTHALVLKKGARDRAGEEQVVSTLLLSALAEACGSPAGRRGDAETGGPEEEGKRRRGEEEGTEPGLNAQRLTLNAPPPTPNTQHPTPNTQHPLTPSPPHPLTPSLLPGEQVIVERHERVSPLGRLLAGEVPAALVLPDGQIRTRFPAPAALFPGAFNPLHAGHLGLAQVAARRLGLPVTFEISAANVDKPPLSEPEIRRRLAQFAGRFPVVVSDAPTFARKAQLFPGCVFLIGADTLERLFAPRYYGSEEAMLAALAAIQAQGCRFLVAGRLYRGAYHAPEATPIPEPFRPMFDFIPPEEFRIDLSSTELRGKR